MDQQPSQAVGQAYPPYEFEGQPDPEKQFPSPEAAYPPQPDPAYPPQQQGYPQQQAYPTQGCPQEGYPQQTDAYPQLLRVREQQPPSYPEGYSQPPPPGYQGYPQSYPQKTASTTALIVTQPTTTTYVQPTQRLSDKPIPTIGLVLTIIHLSICVSSGILSSTVCLLPALICAIVGLTITGNEQTAKTCGWLAIGTNIATFAFYAITIFIVVILLVVGV